MKLKEIHKCSGVPTGVPLLLSFSEIGKESSKSGAQNQGLVSNLQAPDFVLSL